MGYRKRTGVLTSDFKYAKVDKLMEIEVEQLLQALPRPLGTRKVVNFKKDNVVFYKGDVTTHVYLVVSGELAVQSSHANGNIYLISYLSAGSFLGDLEVISEELINATTLVAQTDCILLKFSASDFLNALTLDNDFLLLVSKKLAQKMYKECNRLGESLYKKGVDKLLIYLVKAYRENETENALIVVKTRQIIADEIGINVKTINRSVKYLLKQNSIELVKGKICIKKRHYQSMLILLNK